MWKPKIIRSREAISPILATSLLIVIAVATIVITYAWITLSGTTEKITINIGNSGTSSGQIIQLYLGTSESSLTAQATMPAMPQTIAAGSIISVNITQSWDSETTYYFKVVPSSSAVLSFRETA